MADQFPYFYDEDYDEETNKKVNLEIMKYAGMYLLKLISLSPDEGGHIFEVPLSGLDEHLEPVLDDLLFHNLIEIDAVNTKYKLTKEGENYVDKLIGEIENYIEKYQDFEPVTRVNLMKRNKVNPLRARFLWGLYDGEFDDLRQWQIDWEINPGDVLDWQLYLTKKEFYDELFWDINNMEDLDDDALDEVLQEAEQERQQNMPDIKINRVEGSGSGQSRPNAGNNVVVTEHHYHDPYYFNPVYDPLFWYIVF